jgi:hypothetical protein
MGTRDSLNGSKSGWSVKQTASLSHAEIMKSRTTGALLAAFCYIPIKASGCLASESAEVAVS